MCYKKRFKDIDNIDGVVGLCGERKGWERVSGWGCGFGRDVYECYNLGG